jgi:hypothetical protein
MAVEIILERDLMPRIKQSVQTAGNRIGRYLIGTLESNSVRGIVRVVLMSDCNSTPSMRRLRNLLVLSLKILIDDLLCLVSSIP